MTGEPHLSPALRTAFRLPRHLYRLGFGWLLGHRFVLITHFGRRSGRTYTTVLEVIRYEPRTPELWVVSGFGAQADWLRNIRANRRARISFGGPTWPVQPRILRPAEAVPIFADYERRNRLIRPILRRVLTWLLGWRYDGSELSRSRMAEQLPVVAFRPAAPGSAANALREQPDRTPSADASDPGSGTVRSIR
jgi:deazaflavin-dependent oxidoreductase (nitroreductase family)